MAARNQGSRYHVGVVIPCYNEECNVEALHARLTNVFSTLDDYSYELLFIDNASTDDTVSILRRITARDRHVKVIVNTRNLVTSGPPTMACCSVRQMR